MNRLGRQRVGVGRWTPRLDEHGQPVINELHEALHDQLVLWVDNCLFEDRIPAELDLFELQSVGDRGKLSTASALPAQCFFPVYRGAVLGKDDSGSRVTLPVSEITSRAWLLYGGGRYELRGDAVLQHDDDGREDHAWCRCERTRG